MVNECKWAQNTSKPWLRINLFAGPSSRNYTTHNKWCGKTHSIYSLNNLCMGARRAHLWPLLRRTWIDFSSIAQIIWPFLPLLGAVTSANDLHKWQLPIIISMLADGAPPPRVYWVHQRLFALLCALAEREFFFHINSQGLGSTHAAETVGAAVCRMGFAEKIFSLLAENATK